MKILLSAYACEPHRGSEPDIGFQTMLAIATRHEVWVVTRSNNLRALRQVLDGDEREKRITLIGLDLGTFATRIKRIGRIGLIWYYDRWQRMATQRALELDIEVNFDLVHHITFAAYWMRAGVAYVEKPFVWGPVGGGVEPPISLVPALGWRGALESAMRVTGRRLVSHAHYVRRARDHASTIFVNNPQTAARLSGGRVEILPNPAAVSVPSVLPREVPGCDVAFVGRLVPWKGGYLAVRAMRYVQNPAARLHIFGDGQDRNRLLKAIRRWGLDEKVLLHGEIDRQDLLARLARCGAMIHPAIHEEGGNAVAEALAMEVPVVCLAHGGPSQTVRLFPSVRSISVEPGTVDVTARRLAKAVDVLLSDRRERSGIPLRPELDYKQRILQVIEDHSDSRDGPPGAQISTEALSED